MTISDRLLLDTEYSPQELLADLERIEGSSWISHFVTQNYEGDWDVLPLRGPTGAEHPVMLIGTAGERVFLGVADLVRCDEVAVPVSNAGAMAMSLDFACLGGDEVRFGKVAIVPDP